MIVAMVRVSMGIADLRSPWASSPGENMITDAE